MGAPLQLEAVVRGGRLAGLEATQEAFSEAGVTLLDVHLYSDLSACLVLELAARQGPRLAEALGTRGVALDAPSRARLMALVSEGDQELAGTLALLFAGGRGDLRHETPAVPG